MSESSPEADAPTPAIDEGDENPDSLAGEEVEPEHDLDVEAFTDDQEER